VCMAEEGGVILYLNTEHDRKLFIDDFRTET
jgi:hypothetical protein